MAESTFSPKLVLFNLIITGIVAFLLQSFAVIPISALKGWGKSIQITIVVVYFIITVPLSLFAARTLRKEPLDKVLAYAAYTDFKELLKKLHLETNSAEKTHIISQMNDLVLKMPKDKREWATNVCSKYTEKPKPIT